ncbi:MAG: glycoside hydrolase family 1 protein [Candidatus Dependentiae bacterium]|nr:glycoside hydrolase family 1 protein [Candidatus Dependentiae bacterium]
MKKIIGIVLVCTAIAAFGTELAWDWSTIDVDAVFFDKNFIFGSAVAEYQVSGAFNCPNANWALWDYAKDKHGNPRIHGGQRSGRACDFWHSFKEDIALLKHMKVKAFRFSVEWSIIEPQQGVIDKAAIAHYHELCDELLAAGIKPVVTLHHFTHPLWFEKLGAFELEENIPYFVDFARLMVQELGSKVMLWATFNEPGVYVFQGYIRGVWPPGKIGINRAGKVLYNMMCAHVKAYKAIKNLPGGDTTQVGLVHSVTQFDPYNDDSVIEKTLCYYINHMFHDVITEFFAQGVFSFHVPVLASLDYVNSDAVCSLDFLGINYYSHVLLRVELGFNTMAGQAYRSHEIKTDMPYCIYAEGLYRAIKDVSERITVPQNIPMYITENGIADSKDDRRELFIKRYLYALSRAIQDGYDVRGYFYWSLLDNFEWSEGYTQKFGLYDVDMATQQRTLREGSKALLKVINSTYQKS